MGIALLNIAFLGIARETNGSTRLPPEHPSCQINGKCSLRLVNIDHLDANSVDSGDAAKLTLF
jgi:hypothetical protein